MSFNDLKLVYVLACFGLGLVILLPTIYMTVRLPSVEGFSELWILDSEHMAENYPFNVKENEVYGVYLGIANHMGSLNNYKVYVKFGNQTEPSPKNETPSTLDPLLEYRIFLGNNELWERGISFSFESVSFEGNLCKITRLVVDGYALNVNETAMWNGENPGFYYQLFFELWIYNATASSFQFHNLFVGLWLNMTVLV